MYLHVCIYMEPNSNIVNKKTSAFAQKIGYLWTFIPAKITIFYNITSTQAVIPLGDEKHDQNIISCEILEFSQLRTIYQPIEWSKQIRYPFLN